MKIKAKLNIEHNDNPIPVKLNLVTGEISLSKFLWLAQYKNTLETEYENTIYNFPVKSIAGRYFVEDYKNEDLFKFYNLKKTLDKQLPQDSETKRKLKI